MTEQRTITADPATLPARARSRGQAALRLCQAIAEAHPEDAAHLMTAALQGMQTDGPQYDVFGHLRTDARWWAENAPPHEVQAYVMAGLRQLQGAAIGPSARKELFAALWMGMPAKDKAAFFAKIKGGA